MMKNPLQTMAYIFKNHQFYVCSCLKKETEHLNECIMMILQKPIGGTYFFLEIVAFTFMLFVLDCSLWFASKIWSVTSNRRERERKKGIKLDTGHCRGDK